LIGAVAGACATAPAVALAATTPRVTSEAIRAAVQPIVLTNTVWPIELSGTVLPLEQRHRHGSTSVVTINADVLFAFDRATLTHPAIRTIGDVARRIPHHPARTIRVDGYTDSIGTRAYNDSLSQRRAASVAAALRHDLGGDGGADIVARGHGEADPVAPNRIRGKDNPAGRAKNRRVVIRW